MTVGTQVEMATVLKRGLEAATTGAGTTGAEVATTTGTDLAGTLTGAVALVPLV